MTGASTTLNSSAVQVNTSITTLNSSLVVGNDPDNCTGSSPAVAGCTG
ncbi:hypothetical protein [Streptomyces sp. ME19-01-6]|nr:hypothetical protein [Streptomyces sp. ME19-01-6]MDX3229552.1 hypothetical protein [Streptomyces sp. ME19-01-6]